MTDIERHSLDAHVSICELRYQSLNDRLDRVTQDMDELKTLIQNLAHDLHTQRDHQNDYWARVQWALIGGLISVVAWAVSHWVV
jgi:predicted  nucleic acid-binding Zn-ribbon protein